jgi:hypothetical protein
MIGTCTRCDADSPLWPDGSGLCDDCHYDDVAELAELDRWDDEDEDWDDDEPERSFEDVPTRGLL